MCLASLCAGGQRSFVFSHHKVNGLVLSLQHPKFALIPKCADPLFSDHNGTFKRKGDLENTLYLDGQGRQQWFVTVLY